MTMACSHLVLINNRGELGRHVGDLFQARAECGEVGRGYILAAGIVDGTFGLSGKGKIQWDAL